MYNIPMLTVTFVMKANWGNVRWQEQEHLARHLWGHPLPMAPGRTVSAATDLGVSLYSAPGGGYARPDDVACMIEGVLNAMKHLGMLAGSPQPAPPPTTSLAMATRSGHLSGRWLAISVLR